MACNPKTQAFIVDRDAIDPDEGIQELALFYPNGLPISFGTIASEIDAEVIDARGTYPTLGDRLDAGGGGTGVSDHGALTGLVDDDHKQYAFSFTADFITENTTLSGIPRGVIITGDYLVTMPNTTTTSMVGRVWALTNAFESTVTLNAGSSGALFNGSDQTFELRPGRQIQVTLINIPGVGDIWGLGGLLPVPAVGGALGVDDIVAGTNVTVEKSPDNQQITISAAGGSGGGTSDHGALTGLGDDDHHLYSIKKQFYEINTSMSVGGLPAHGIFTGPYSIDLPTPPDSRFYGRPYSFTNRHSAPVTITADATTTFYNSTSSLYFYLPPGKEVDITAINIPGTGVRWYISNLAPMSDNITGSMGFNDITAGVGITVEPETLDSYYPLSISFTGSAADVSFTPANAAHWPTQPTTVGEALNLLAGRVSGLEP